MKKVLGFLLTPVFQLYMIALIIGFYPVQVIALKLFGEHARRRSVDLLNIMLLRGLWIMGARVRYLGLENLPKDRPVIVVANHQSMYDIPAIGWIFRDYYPKFIAKIELSKNMFSISYNLKHGQSALIDRANGSQSVREILKLGKLIEKNNYAACIFPEGTRSKDGQLKPFMSAGIQTLLRGAPSAVIVPFVISGHHKILKNGNFPLQFGEKVTYQILKPVEPCNYSSDEITGYLEKVIEEQLQ
ncbi:lysophospholipid acyltransferase family protein [Marinilabilia salmonicolor]|uniref:lysophospholipid acyltransferase family protein n=1 Tax=Marinilabilia salmonicolor TaxID=989 RepID=UPI00029B50A9|nr:lysophospholipid acyltransferase family protein [Marinilabilia salmonicolor]